jgi:hypothetical protein
MSFAEGFGHWSHLPVIPAQAESGAFMFSALETPDPSFRRGDG